MGFASPHSLNRHRPMTPTLPRLETELSERLGTSVKIDCDTDGQGHLVVTFANLEILEEC